MIKFIFIFLFVACAQTTNQKSEPSNIVDLSDITETKKVNIDKDASVDYGPVLNESPKESSELDKEEVKKKKLYSLVLQPALYKSFGYIAFFKEIEKSNRRPIVISSFGFSAITAALYAKLLKPNLVEWKIYELYQSIKDEEIYTKEWLEKVEEFLNKEFSNQKLSQLKILVLIPYIYKDKVRINPTAMAKDIIMQSIDMEAKKSKSFMLKSNMSFVQNFKNYGSEDVVYISNLPANFKIKAQNELIKTNFSRLANNQLKASKLYTEHSNLYLDQIINISDEMNQVTISSKEYIKEYFEEN
tara:strand:- start:81804 stop:82706 length:903 start_codon:yes stop_codon:yes gene_type:complete